MSHLLTLVGQSIGISASSISLSNECSRLISFRVDLFDLLAPQDAFQSPLQHHNFKSINSLALSLLYDPILTSVHNYWKTIRTLSAKWWCPYFYIYIYILVQSLSHVWLFEIPCTAAHQASLSITNSWSLLKLMFIELDLLAVQGTLKSLLQHHSEKASILWSSAFIIVQLSHPYMTTEKNIIWLDRSLLAN